MAGSEGGQPGGAAGVAHEPGAARARVGTAAAGLREPERGPIARVFHAWDALSRPLAKAGGKLDAALSKYHGVSDRARMALRGYGGRREFSGLQSFRVAEQLDRAVKERLGVKTLEEALPHELKIQHAIEEPDNPAYRLTPAEAAVRDELLAVRDGITVREVGRGWLTPEALRGARLDSLEPGPRQTLETALRQWETLKSQAEAMRRQRDAELEQAGKPPLAEPAGPQALIRWALGGLDPRALAGLRGRWTQLGPGVRELMNRWINDAIPGTEEEYWPHDYLDMPPEQPGGKRPSRYSSMSARPKNLTARRTFPTLSAAEAAGFQPDPDAVGVITRRLHRSMMAQNASDLLRDIGQLGEEEYLPTAHTQHGEPVAEPGYRLAGRESALRGKLKAAEMGGREPQVSEKLARAIEEIVGPGKERGKAARIAQGAWLLQRAWNFWNITKHSSNVAMLALQRGWAEGTRALLTGRPHAAAAEARIAAGPLSFLLDPGVLRQSLERKGPLFDLAVKTGAVRARLGRAGSFGSEALPGADDAIRRAHEKVFGAPGMRKITGAVGKAMAFPHWFTFDFLDAGIRLEMFQSLLSEGMSPERAADEVNRWLVEYGDVRRGPERGLVSRAFYTFPYMKGAAKSVGEAWRRNPFAAAALYGAIYGTGGLASLGIAGYEERKNREQTGHGMAQNPPGEQDRFEIGTGPTGLPRSRRVSTPMGMPADAAAHPASFAWNRLDPWLRAAAQIASNEHTPPNRLPDAPWGQGVLPREWPVVPPADAAAAAAGNYRPALADWGRLLAEDELGGPVRDVSGAYAGTRPLADLVAPVTTRTGDPYQDTYADLEAEQALEAAARKAAEQGTPPDQVRARYLPDIQRTLARGFGDARRAAALFRATPPARNAARTRALLERDYAGLMAAARRVYGAGQ